MKNINTCYARKHDRSDKKCVECVECVEYYCPYPTNERCDEIHQKLRNELRLTFKCIRCNLPFCATYAYSEGSSYCWPCGLKTPQYLHNKGECGDDIDVDMT